MRFLSRILVAYSLLLLLIAHGHAQEAPSAVPSAASTPALIGLGDIGQALEKHATVLEQIDAEGTLRRIESSKSSLQRLQKEVHDDGYEVEALGSGALQAMNFEELASRERVLQTHWQEIDSLRNGLASEVTRLVQLKSQLLDGKVSWNRSLAAIPADELSGPIRNRIRDAIRDGEMGIRSIQDLLDQLVPQQADLALLAADVREYRRIIKDVSAMLPSHFLARTPDPIYSGQFWWQLTDKFESVCKETIRKRRGEVVDYLSQNSNRVIVHIGLILLLAWIVFYLKRTEVKNGPAQALIRSPWLIIIAGALLLNFAVYPDADVGFFSVVRVLLVLPIILLLRDIFEGRHSSFIYAVGLLYLLDRIREFLAGFVALEQLILLAQLLLACFLSYCIGSIPRTFTYNCDGRKLVALRCAIIWLARGAVYIFAVNALLLVAGYYALALYVGGTLLNAVYLALVLFVMYRVVTIGFTSLTRHGFLSVSRYLTTNGDKVEYALQQITALVLIVAWGYFLLRSLGWHGLFISRFWALGQAGITLGQFSLTLGGVTRCFLILFVGLKLSGLLRDIVQQDLLSRSNYEEGVKYTIDIAIRYALLCIIIIAAIAALGVGVKNLALIAGALSVGIGFGLQNIVNNFVSGIIILFERPIKVGDLVVIGTDLGTISRIGIRSCTLRTLEESEVIFPNATIVTEKVVNWTHTSSRARVGVLVEVAGDTDIRFCQKILLEAVKELPFALETPAPSVLLKEFSANGTTLEVRVWIRDVKSRPELQGEISIVVNETLHAHGVVIPVPQREIKIVDRVENG